MGTIPSLISSALSDDNLDKVCPICFDILREPFTTKCTHNFHHDCLCNWLKHVSGSCPLCKSILQNNNSVKSNKSNMGSKKMIKNVEIYMSAKGKTNKDFWFDIV